MTHSLHDVQASKGASKVDSSKDDLSDERIRNTNRLEDRSSIVEEIVGAGQLLQALERHPQEGAVEGLVSGLEAINPASPDPLLHLELVNDLVDLCEDVAVGGRVLFLDTIDTRNSFCGLVPLSLCRQPSVMRRVRILNKVSLESTYRGDSGIRLIPAINMAGKINPSPMSNFQDESPPRERVPMAMQSRKR